jgi:hypothetical protein
MVKVKNVRAGILLVSDAGLQLAPGAVAEVTALTPQIERAVTTGHLVLVREEAMPAPQPAVDDLSALQAPEAVARVQAETDVAQLQAWLASEKRRSVITAINARLQELGANTG